MGALDFLCGYALHSQTNGYLNEGSFDYLQMRRVGSNGGPSGVACSERLKQRLSSTPGLHLLSSSALGESGFLAAVGDTQDERVIHRTFRAARNFFAIASNLKQAKRKSWVNRKAPLAPLSKYTIIFDEPFDTYQLCNGSREGFVEGIPDVPSNDSQVIEEVEFEEAFQISSSSDNLPDASTSASFDTGKDGHQGNRILKSEVPSNLCHGRVDLSWNETRSQCSWVGADLHRKESDPVEVSSTTDSPPFGLAEYQKCESSVLGAHLESGEVQGVGSHLETERMSIAIAEAEGCVSSLPTSDGQDSRSSRAEKFEANSAGNVVIRSNEVLHLLGTGAGLQDSEIDLSKDMAAVVIQSCWRGWQERKHLNGISQAAMLLQQYWRAFQSLQALKRRKTGKASREQRRINIVAGVVQSHWRSAQSRRVLHNLREERDVRAQERNDHAAVMVQKHWRAQRGRCLVKHLKGEQVAREQQRIGAAAVVLQKHWRAWRGSFLVKHLKMEQAVKEKQRMDIAAVVLQKHWRAQQGRYLMKHLRIEQAGKEKQRMTDAAVVLQKHWRAHQGMCIVKHLRMKLLVKKERIEHAAMVLQKHWRRQHGRCLLRQLRMEQVAKEQQKTNMAATVLQKFWRAQQGRHLVKRLNSEQVVREHQRINDAAVVLQKHWRAKQGRYLLKHLNLEQVARQQSGTDNAAIGLQKHWQAKLGRSLVKHPRMEQVATEEQRPNDAAIVLQKYWRARQGRSYKEHWKLEQVAKEQQTLDHAAVVIQKHWRAQQGRCFVEQLRMEQVARVLQKLNNAAIVLQKHRRAQQSRCLLKRWKLEQFVREKQRIDASTVLQKHWRAHQSRAFVEHMKKEQLLRQWEMDHAAEVLQKHWRGRQSRYLVNDLKKKQIADKAIFSMQKCWRAQQSSLTMKRLKVELAPWERLRANAATTLQKHWRARQSMLIMKHMKVEDAVREQDTLDNAAIISQKHWRGQHGRFLVEHLKREKALRELERVNNAAIVLQKSWRCFQSRQFVKFPYIKQAGSERALCTQARVRDNATRVKFEAALTIQKAWQLYWSSRLTVSSVPIQHPFPSSSDQKRKIQAVIVLQAYARGFVIRRRLGPIPKSAYVSVQPDQSGNKRYTETGMAAVSSPDVMLTGSSLHAIDVTGYLSRAEEYVESCSSSSIVHHVYAGVGSADQKSSPSDRWQELECAPITFQKQDLSASLGLDGDFSATSLGKAQLQKNGVQEDCNYVAVDQLEECLNTCLAAPRSVPSGSQHCLPGLGVPHKSHFIGTDQKMENNKNVDNGEAGIESSHPIKPPSHASSMQSDYVTSQTTLTGGKDRLEISSSPVQVTGTQYTKNPTQRKRLGRRTAEQNEQRLKQFAQVFLLQRHIALQQQRAQTVPPFPPPIPSGSDIPSHMVTQPVEKERSDGGAAVQNISMHTDSQVSKIEGRRPEEHHVVCEIVDPDDEQIATRRSQARQKSGSKQRIERPGPDVVLDMVLLLRRIEEECRTSEGDFEGQSRTWCTSGCGDIEEGIPLLNMNSGSRRKQSSVAKFVNAVNMKHISIPDVNAVLIVFIAMVVYTRTVCKGLFFGSRQIRKRS